MKRIRSPLFYVGDKYKLMAQLTELFPRKINTFYDVFTGGGSASINTIANNYKINDIDKNVMKLHELLKRESKDIEHFIYKMSRIIEKYNLSHSELGKNKEIELLKQTYKKTYFSIYNKEAYLNLRDDFNQNQTNIELLYLLLVYGFNHMIRFNKKGDFNLPVGNVDWNKNVTCALRNYADWINYNKVELHNSDFMYFVKQNTYLENDFLYFDPPYLISLSDYNKLWNENSEKRLYSLLDKLDKNSVKWGISNLLKHKGKTNVILFEWSKKYNVYQIDSNYISRFDNSIKENSKELYVTNVKKGE